MATFEIGEIAIFVYVSEHDLPPWLSQADANLLASLDGQECEIKSNLHFDDQMNCMVYEIEFPRGEVFFTEPQCLRKKPKPGDEEQTRSFDSLIRWCKKAGRKNKVAEQA